MNYGSESNAYCHSRRLDARSIPGRKPVPDRAALNGIVFVLRTGLRWRDLPAEMGLRLRRDLLASLTRLARSRRVGSIVPSAARRATRSGPNRLVTRGCRFVIRAGYRGGPKKTGLNPVDRARPGSKHHVATDANGVPLSIILTGANRHDVTQLLPLIDAIPAIRGYAVAPCKSLKWSLPIAGTTLKHTDRNCAIAVLNLLSPSAALNMAADLESIDG